uniref:Putative leucine-rich repeat protein n=1 Tax=Culex tarsalis TaxID=7177 RepID=A0A1Q3FPF0_CULTA
MKLLRTLMVIALGSLATAEVENHVCIPTGYSRICILEDINYQLNGTTTHVFPEGQKHIRIRETDDWKSKHSNIPHFDTGLYLLLGNPTVLEARNVGIETLDIPPTLRHGNFKDNSIRTSWVTVNEEDNVEPSLVYLNLANNWISQLPNGIQRLGNLEILILDSNSIETIPPNTLTKLTKLKIVSISFNSLHRFSTELFPTSLTYLDLFLNNLDHDLEYDKLHFPAMETLNLERNRLKQIDASALIMAMPQLKTVRISGNSFSEDQLRSAVEVFRRRNITFQSEVDEESCFYDEDTVEGVCLQLEEEPMGVPQAIVFTVMVVMVAVIFVLVTRWVLRQMNK